MKMFVITPSGDRVEMEAFTGFSVHKIAEGDPGALRTLQHARESSDVTDFPEVVALVDAMLANPTDAPALILTCEDGAATRFGIAMSLAYIARTPGASMSMEPETQEERERLASMQRPPGAVQ